MQRLKDWLLHGDPWDQVCTALVVVSWVFFFVATWYKPLPWGVVSAAWLLFISLWLDRIERRR